MRDQNYIRAKDITLVLTVLTLLGTLWKFSGFEDLKNDVKSHSIQIAVIQSTLNDIKQDVSDIKKAVK